MPGCFDSLGKHRATLMASLNNALQQAEQSQQNAAFGQHDLLSMHTATEVQYIEVPAWDDTTQLLLKNAGTIDAPQTEIKIGNITVKIPEKKPSSSQKSARDQRKENRSASLLILESSIKDDYNPESTT